MILTTHALVGAALGKNIPNVWILIPASIIIHFVLDTFRHGEYVEIFDKKISSGNIWWKVGFDISATVIFLLLFIFFGKLDLLQIRNVMLGSFFSAFPDLLTVIYWKFKFEFLAPVYRFHSWVHKYPKGAKEREWTLRNGVNDILFSLAAIIIFIIF